MVATRGHHRRTQPRSAWPPGDIRGRISWREPFPPYRRRRRLTVEVERVLPQVRIAHRRPHLAHIPRLLADHELILVCAGRGELRCDDGAWPLGPGSVIAIPPFHPFAIAEFEGPGEHLALHFDLAPGLPDAGSAPERRRAYEVEVRGVPTLPRTHPGDADLERWFTTALRSFDLGTPSGRWEAGLACARILGRLWATPPAVHDPAVAAACAAARAALGQTFDVADLAQAADLSPSRLRARFLAATGLSPRNWLAGLRIDQARRLLAETDDTLATIATACGFADAYHLSHAFTRCTGESPSAFRTAVAAGRAWQA